MLVHRFSFHRFRLELHGKWCVGEIDGVLSESE